MEGHNKSARTRRSRPTAELKVSHVTTFVGVINPFLPPRPPFTPAGQPEVISWHAHMSNTSFCPRILPLPGSAAPPLPSAPVTFPITSVSPGVRKHVATTRYVRAGILGMNITVFRWRNIW